MKSKLITLFALLFVLNSNITARLRLMLLSNMSRLSSIPSELLAATMPLVCLLFKVHALTLAFHTIMLNCL